MKFASIEWTVQFSKWKSLKKSQKSTPIEQIVQFKSQQTQM